MKCPEVREYLIAFLDNELDSQMSVDIQLHLEHCCHCANEAEIEQTIRKQLGQCLDEKLPERMMDQKTLLRQLRTSDSQGRTGLRRWFSRSGWPAAILAMVATATVLIIGSQLMLPSHSESFADMLVKDLQHLSADGPLLDIVSDDPEEITAWIHRQMHWDVKISKSTNAAFQLLGARRCSIGGRHAALTYYQINGTAVSLVVLPSTQNDFTGMQMTDKSNYFVDECKGYVVVASQDGSLTYAAIGTVSQDQLLGLIPVSLGKGAV